MVVADDRIRRKRTDEQVDHGSLWLDLQMLLATVLHVAAVPTSLIGLLFWFPDVPEKAPGESVLHARRPAERV